MQTYVADFETTIPKPIDYEVDNEGNVSHDAPDVDESTRVWAYGVCEVGNVSNFKYGNNIDDFMTWCKTGKNKLVYFHNLKFDGEFIFYWLLTNGFTYSEEKESNTFNCIVSEMGQFYAIEVIFTRKNKKYKKVTFHDSLKKLPFPVSKIGKDFKLPIQKLEVPDDFYEWERKEGHELTDLELDYLRNDVQTVAMALGIQFEQELTRMTVGSDALNSFKEILGERLFERMFPVLPMFIDMDIRHAYRGGFTYLQEQHAEKDIGEGIVYDVNSLYPSVMYYERLPYGMPIHFKGKYEFDDLCPLYIQRLTCTFRLKKDHIPMIQIKHGGRYKSTEYLKTSMDSMGHDEVTLVLTSVDLALFFKHYDVTVLSWEGGWKFKECVGLFKEYIDHWTTIKIENSKEKNALYTLAKLMLNSLYGKFATNPNVTGKHPYLNDAGAISYRLNDEELRDPVYTAMGAFITAWARHKTITTAQDVYDRFIYADTDSIHLIGADEPDIETHDNALGKWACEGVFERARFLRAKTYVEQFDGHLHVTCAGMPENVKQAVTWDNFHVGLRLPGKLVPHHVPGGIVLKPTDFTISREKKPESYEQWLARWEKQQLKEAEYDSFKEAVLAHGYMECVQPHQSHYWEYKELSASKKRKYFRKKGVAIDVMADLLDMSVNELFERLS